MKCYDHFHLIYEINGEKNEIEGGWVDNLKDIQNMSNEEYQKYVHKIGVDWGMPEEGVPVSFKVCG